MQKIRVRHAHSHFSKRNHEHTRHDIAGNAEDLRSRAEDALREKPFSTREMSDEEVQRLIHELQVHQIELKMQNESLRQTQEELEAARERYFDLFDQAPIGYLMLSEKGVVLAANRAAASLLGIEREELENTALTRYILREDQDIFYLESREALQKNNRHQFELRMVKRDGSQVCVQIECTGIIAQGQPTRQMRVMLNDITEQKQHERTLKAYADKLEILNQDMQGFAYMASHDLQEPLHKIKGFGNILKKDYGPLLDAVGQNYIDRMEAAASRMERLIRDLLSLSRLSNVVPAYQEVDLNKIVYDVLSDLESRIEESGGQVEVGEMPVITAEPTQMQQLFQNIIGNALKYHEPGSPPVVKVEATLNATRMVEIRIIDQGIGFAEQAVTEIFKPFVRLHGRSEYDGTGIGLATCRRIVENHAGKITAKSAPGQGATFIVQLPVQQPAAREV